ncbi:MAG: efflux RND transporter periplasmic adaptor subunit [Spirochaetaceae bacterium]|jgi:multidrug efflux pump subunit AcrA (membrane-fusion protein)|nr:efflux RND transporter periplasmic adaptor subunit [Spirochaetaceae bacterium]
MRRKKRRNNAAKVIIFVIILFLGLTLIVYMQRTGGGGAPGGGLSIPFLGAATGGNQIDIPVSPGGERPTSADGSGGGAPQPGAADGSGSSDSGRGSGRGGGAGSAERNAGSGERNAGSGERGGRGERGNAAAGERNAGSSNRTQTGGNAAAGAQTGNNAAGAARNIAVVRVTPVVLGSIENSIIVNGDVIASRQVSLYPQLAGKIAALQKRVGDAVSTSEVVAYIDPSKPGEVFANSPLRSTIGGTVIQAPFNVGDTVSTQSAIYIVGDLTSLVIETYIPERFTGSIKKGLAAEIYFDSIPDETFAGLVREVSPIIDPASRTMRIQIQFVHQDPRIRSGMFATISLVINTKRGVPVIPRNTVINTYGRWIVFVVDDKNTAQRREVATGLESDTEVEIVSGLQPGEKVVSAGQNFLSDGDPLRITE